MDRRETLFRTFRKREDGNASSLKPQSQSESTLPVTPFSDIRLDWATNNDGLFRRDGMAIVGNTMYVANFYSSTISQVDLGTGNVTIPDWGLPSDNITSPVGLAVYKNILYIANYGNNTIAQVDLSEENPVAIIPDWGQDTENIQGPVGLVVYKNILYITNYFGSFISQVNLSEENPVVKRPSWGSDPKIQFPSALAVSGNFLYIANNGNDTLLQVDLVQGVPVSSFPLPYDPNFLTINGNQLYVSGINYNTDDFFIARMNLLPPLTFP